MTEASARVIADSITEDGHRLTTFEATCWRPVLAEQNTHCVLCLAGDAELEFDLPCGSRRKSKYVWRMTIADFVDKWHEGARRVGANPKVKHDLTWIEPDEWYPASVLTDRLSMSKPLIHGACRDAVVDARRGEDGRSWEVLGSSFVAWRESSPEHTRFSIRDRLATMRIRQLNEDTGDVQTSTVVNAVYSGRKEVFEVTAKGFVVAGSKDHKVLTSNGYRTIEELVPGVTEIVVRKFGKRDDDLVDPTRLKRIDGKWRSVWQRKKRAELTDLYGGCQRCGSTDRLNIHHVVPVYERPDLAFEDSNVLLLCETHHYDEHRTQSWQKENGSYLYGATVVVESVVSRGEEDTYDLSIAGAYPNFLANGVVVHNSRNSASSRAIPVTKMLERFNNDFAMPLVWPSEIRGMQGGPPLTEQDLEDAQHLWNDLAVGVYETIEDYVKSHPNVRLHKSMLNRWLEPGLWQTQIISATQWDGYFWQRCHKDAEPHIRAMAEAIYEAREASTPEEMEEGYWHLPYWDEAGGQLDDWDDAITLSTPDLHPAEIAKRCSAARCARVSYLTQDGKRDLTEDLKLWDRLTANRVGSEDPPHASPLEHVASPWRENQQDVTMPNGVTMGPLPKLGKFVGWLQLRHLELGF